MKPQTLVRKFIVSLAVMMTPLTAQAQTPPPPAEDEPELVEFDTAKTRSIAVPALVAPSPADTAAGNTTALGRQIAEVISADLRASGVFETSGPNGLRAITLGEVTAPQFDYWKARPVEQLVQGFVRVGGDSNLTVGCYLYDVGFGSETTRLGFNVPARDWRRAAHKCADAIYSKLTGEAPFFDSRIAYIAESGPKGKRVKRLAIMDSDGANHRFITNGQSTALTPRFSPNYKSILYLSYVDGNPRIYVYDIDGGRQRLITQSKIRLSRRVGHPMARPSSILWQSQVIPTFIRFRRAAPVRLSNSRVRRASMSVAASPPTVARSFSKATVRAASKSM